MKVLSLLALPFFLAPGPWSGAAFSQTSLYEFDGPVIGARFGVSVRSAGDVDADGFPDVIVGGSSSSLPGTGLGLARVHSGRTGRLLHSFHPTAGGGGFGFAVCGAGDVDADGHADLVVGAPAEHFGPELLNGTVRVYSGRTGALLHLFHGDHAERFGASVAGAGDVNRDGFDDLVVGSLEYRSGALIAAGKAVVLDGRSGAVLHSWVGTQDIHNFGASVAGAGDVDGDQYPDLIVGAPGEDGGGLVNRGAAYVYSGRTGALLQRLDGSSEGDFFGTSVSSAGDLDGDGRDEVLVGSRFAVDSLGNRVGSATVFSAGGVVLHELVAPHGAREFGFAVSAAGDVDADGVQDLVVGAPRTSVASFQAGAVYLFSGGDGRLLREIHGFRERQEFGTAVDDAGDVNADGRADVIVGAPLDSAQGAQSGLARVLSLTPFQLRSIDPQRASFRGGEELILHGSGFSGSAEVSFDGVPADETLLLEGGRLRVRLPRFERGGGEVSVWIVQEGAIGLLPGALTVTPFHDLRGTPRIGESFALRFLGEPGDSLFVFLGGPPRTAHLIAGHAGLLEVLPFIPLASSAFHFVQVLELPIGIPADPELIGVQLATQGLSGPMFAAGRTSFTNPVTWVIEGRSLQQTQ